MAHPEDDPAKDRDPKTCDHERIEIVGGGGDERGFYDTFECIFCCWQFELFVDGKDES